MFGFCFQQNNNHEDFHRVPIGGKQETKRAWHNFTGGPVLLKKEDYKAVRYTVAGWRRRKRREKTWVMEGNEREIKKNQREQREMQLSPSIQMLWQQLTGRESCSLLLSFHHCCPPTRLPNAHFLFPWFLYVHSERTPQPLSYLWLQHKQYSMCV